MSNKATEYPERRMGRLRDAALLIALLPVVAAALRVWLFSGGDVSLFLLLLKTLNITAALIASTVLTVPHLLLVVVYIVLTDWRARDWVRAALEGNNWLVPATPVFLLILVYTANLWFWLIAGAIGLAVAGYFLIKRFWHWAYENVLRWLVTRRGDNNGPNSLITFTLLLLLILITPTSMWLPLERVQHSDNSVLLGYVLETNSEWTTLLSFDREVEILRTSDLTAREVCRPSGPVSVATLLYPQDVAGAPNCGALKE